MADWLPADVKLHFSVVDYPTARPLFEQTGIGRLLQDDAMQPFLEDLPRQLRSRARDSWLGLMWVDLGVSWSQFAEVPSGEVAWAVFHVNGAPASLLLADVSGSEDQVERLRDRIAAAMAQQNVTATRQEIDGVTLSVYGFPEREGKRASQLIHGVRDGVFMATHSLDLMRRMLPRVGKEQPDNLSGLAAHQHVMNQCRTAAGEDPHATLYLVPFDCLELMDAVAEEEDVQVERSPDLYRSQGFDALSAIGATIRLRDAQCDARFHASLYAPKPWSRSMQMVDLRNGPLPWEDWVDQSVSSCSLLNLHAESVYENLGPFFDEVVAQGAVGTWDDILRDLREVEDGPRLDLEKEIFRYLNAPVTVIENEALPVTPETPQVLMAIHSTDEPALRAGIKKGMHDDPYILRKEIAGTTCYHVVSQDNEDELLWIICVAQNHLFMANDFDILTPILQRESGQPLREDPAVQQAVSSWEDELAAETSTMTFYRLDRWLLVRWELLRMGQRIDPRKSLSGMLNAFLGGESMEPEQPELDGSRLPPFEKVRQYFGTFDAAAVTTDAGWLVSGHLRS